MKISNLYNKIVPTYLKEDNPVGIPKEAKDLVEKMSKQTPQPAIALDAELSFLFRNSGGMRLYGTGDE